LTKKFQKNSEIISGEFVELSLSDTGIGLDADSIAQIFEPFLTSEFKGSNIGLGLLVSYGIAIKNAGIILVSSEFGKGLL
jgi:signal transduction histidine kinase